MRRCISILIIGLMLSLCFIVNPVSSNKIETTSTSNTLYVGGSGLGNYSSIKSAIENASDGDTVFVYADSSPYYEHIKINKSITLIGGDKPIIDGIGTGKIIEILDDNVEINNFIIQNGECAIFSSTKQHIIKNNVIQNIGRFGDDGGYPGILLFGEFEQYICIDSKHVIMNNLFQNNSIGLDIFFLNRNIISGNTFKNNSGNIIAGYKNTIKNNNFENNIYGLVIHLAENEVLKNIFQKNLFGLIINNGVGNNIKLNTIKNNHFGLDIYESGFNVIKKNNIIENEIEVRYSRSCLDRFSRNYWGGNSLLPKKIESEQLEKYDLDYFLTEYLEHLGKDFIKYKILKIFSGIIEDLAILKCNYFNYDFFPALKPYNI